MRHKYETKTWDVWGRYDTDMRHAINESVIILIWDIWQTWDKLYVRQIY